MRVPFRSPSARPLSTLSTPCSLLFYSLSPARYTRLPARSFLPRIAHFVRFARPPAIPCPRLDAVAISCLGFDTTPPSFPRVLGLTLALGLILLLHSLSSIVHGSATSSLLFFCGSLAPLAPSAVHHSVIEHIAYFFISVCFH